MKTCEKHSWVVIGHGNGPRPIMFLQCGDCGQQGQMLPTADEWKEYQGWIADVGWQWLEAHDLTGRIETVIYQPADSADRAADDLLTAGDDVDAVGNMGWLQLVANKANEIDQYLGFGAATPTSCNHYWHVGGIIGQGTDGAEIELQCARCHEYATVLHVTDDEAETIGKAWSMGMALEWQNNDRVTLYRDRRPSVADLVDRLELFEVDEGDDDVPF